MVSRLGNGVGRILRGPTMAWFLAAVSFKRPLSEPERRWISIWDVPITLGIRINANVN